MIGEIARGEVVGEVGLIERAPAVGHGDRAARQHARPLQRRGLPHADRRPPDADAAAVAHDPVPARTAQRPHRPGTIDRRGGHRPARHADARHPAGQRDRPPRLDRSTCGRRASTPRSGATGLVESGLSVTQPALLQYMHEAETTHDYLVLETRCAPTHGGPSWRSRSPTGSSSSALPSPTPTSSAGWPSGRRRGAAARARGALAGARPPSGHRTGRSGARRSPIASGSTASPTCGPAVDRRPQPPGPPRVGERHRPRARRRRRPRLRPPRRVAGARTSSGSRSTPSAGRRSVRRWARSWRCGIPHDELVGEVVRLFHGLLDYTVPIVSLIKGERISRNIARTFADGSTCATCGCRSSACRRTSPGRGSRCTTAATLATAIRAERGHPRHPPAGAASTATCSSTAACSTTCPAT